MTAAILSSEISERPADVFQVWVRPAPEVQEQFACWRCRRRRLRSGRSCWRRRRTCPGPAARFHRNHRPVRDSSRCVIRAEIAPVIVQARPANRPRRRSSRDRAAASCPDARGEAIFLFALQTGKSAVARRDGLRVELDPIASAAPQYTCVAASGTRRTICGCAARCAGDDGFSRAGTTGKNDAPAWVDDIAGCSV